ncbi:hypothetical protein D3C80_1680500 [compost metagenome]
MTSKDTDLDSANENTQLAGRPLDLGPVRKRKKKKYTDDHVQKTYYIEKTIFAAIEEIIGDSWGETSKLINTALSSHIANKYPKIAQKHGVVIKDDNEE